MSDYYEGLNIKLLKSLPSVTRVLELGCANGNLGKEYKALNPSSQWIGVDLLYVTTLKIYLKRRQQRR